jgi:hypothetical protein
MRPENELPVSVALDVVLLRGPDLVVCVCGARAFSTVIEFRLMAASRIRTAGAVHGLSGALFGHGDPADRLLLGVEYSDGRTGNNLGGFRGAWESGLDPASPALLPGGGGGGDRLVDLAVSLSPLPPPGDLRIIAAWPARELPETVTVLDADRLIEAASRAVTLWELPDDEPPPPPPPPQVPPGSWFDRGQD